VIDFATTGTAMGDQDWNMAIELTGAESAALWAVLSVETSGAGYLNDRRPKILFERHYFSRLTAGKFDTTHPEISSTSAGGYGPAGAHQYDRLLIALQLDQTAALQSASWGLGQIMGTHFAKLDFASVDDMVAAFVETEGNQLLGIAKFLRSSGLDGALRDKNWTQLAKGYNGPNYASNQYDVKLATFYERYSKGATPDLSIRAAQLYLSFAGYRLVTDGIFGNATAQALSDFQTRANLPVTGQVNPETLAILATPTGAAN